MRKVLSNSFTSALKGKIWKWLLGSVSAVSCVLSIAKNYIDFPLLKSLAIGACVILSVFIIRFGSAVGRNLFKLYHFKTQEIIYGEAIILLKDSFAKINALRKSNFDDKEFLSTTKTMCDNLKILFDKKTKANCSVSIKLPKSATVSAGAAVDNLCRDTAHSTRDTDKYKSTEHTIIGNTGYTMILHNVQTKKEDSFHYINNNIPKTPDYQNTSKGIYNDGILPYKSELICPILPIQRKEDKDFHIWGFICVDCDSINGFDSKYDKAIIEGVADGVHDILITRNSFKIKENA